MLIYVASSETVHCVCVVLYNLQRTGRGQKKIDVVGSEKTHFAFNSLARYNKGETLAGFSRMKRSPESIST